LDFSIETINLTKRFPVIRGYIDLISHPFKRKEITALRDVNLRVRKGEVLGLLGPNGAGKTTLIKILCTLILPTAGIARVGGYDISREGKKVRKIIGYIVSDERSFYWRLTGRQNLEFFAKLNNIEKHEADKRIERLIDLMGLQEDLDRMFKDYSNGMKQNLAIIRGLITDPEIVFMDEPTRSLDPTISQDLRRLVREKLVTDGKKTVLYATHNLREAEEICDNIAIINHGEIVTLDTIDELKKQFISQKSYVIKLKSQNDCIIDRIKDCKGVKNVRMLSHDSGSDEIKFELQTFNDRDGISSLIKEIIEMGGDIKTVHEKDDALGNVYASIVSAKDI
jgi:ABC-2 type transport system ATP-binding protein